MRRVALLLAALSPLWARIPAAAAPVELKCKLYGVLAGDKHEYKTVVEAAWKFDPASLKLKPLSAGGGCSPVGRKSPVFGSKKGTRLQFSAWKCSDDEPYFYAMALINGMRVSQSVGWGRVGFNDDGTDQNVVVEPGGELPPQTPLSLPEGKFRFLYWNCGVANQK